MMKEEFFKTSMIRKRHAKLSYLSIVIFFLFFSVFSTSICIRSPWRSTVISYYLPKTGLGILDRKKGHNAG
jgi:hypothetical protein